MASIVSAIIPCFNTAKYLAEAVNSVLSQTFTDLECIIVDDGSTDNTRQISKALVEKDARVKYLFKENGGLSSARNFGIKHAEGRWIQLLDADDLIHEDKIRFQLDIAEEIRSEECVILYSDYEVFWEDENRKVIKREVITVGKLNKQQLMERLMNGGFKANLPLHPNNTLFQKEVFNRKIYNESLRAYEDMEVWVDLLMRKDISFIYTPICGMYYRIHHSNMTRDHSFMQHAYINFLKEVYKKDKNLLKQTPHVRRLSLLGIKKKDVELIDSLICLLKLTKAPVFLDYSKKNVNVGPLLVKAHDLKLLFPVAAIWYRLKSLKGKFVRFVCS